MCFWQFWIFFKRAEFLIIIMCISCEIDLKACMYYTASLLNQFLMLLSAVSWQCLCLQKFTIFDVQIFWKLETIFWFSWHTLWWCGEKSGSFSRKCAVVHCRCIRHRIGSLTVNTVHVGLGQLHIHGPGFNSQSGCVIHAVSNTLFTLNWRLGSSANHFLHRPFPFLPDWFHGLWDHLMFLFCSTAGFVCMLCWTKPALSRFLNAL